MTVTLSRLTRIAQVVHAAELEYDLRTEGDPQKPWDESGERHRDAVIKHVNFALENPCATPRFLYEAWHAERAEGAPRRGSVGYDELPVRERVKYHLFKNTVAAFDAV